MTRSRGITETGSILDRIVADKYDALQEAKRRAPESALNDRMDKASYGQNRGLSAAIKSPPANVPRGATIQIISEIKKASPSRGLLAPDLDHQCVAQAYTLAGAAGISVVTEVNHFQGSLDWLRDVRLLLQKEFASDRPSVLRKDFVTDPYELVQSRAYGADNVLLIVAILEDALLNELLTQARGLELDALVEVHDEAEAERATKAGATLLGINNRDLHTFAVDLATTERIRPSLPPDAVVVGESGVHTRADVERLQRAGVQAVLVGEAFMTAPDIAAKMAELRP
jgi:indole-3-glycerol phosphate synthase